jgi:hypothetical protein
MWETTSAAAGYDKGWKWDDPKWSKVAGSLAELLGPGPPDFFISHNWGGAFAHFVAAVERHFKTRVEGKLKGKDGEEKTEDNTFYWVCTFANNQHDPKHDIAEAGPADGWGFAKALNVAQSVVSIQDDTQVGSFTLYRAWCAFEFWWAMRKGYPIDILCAGEECGADVCKRLKEFSINPAPESGLIVGMFASKWTDYGKIKDQMMKGDASWRPTLKIAWKRETDLSASSWSIGEKPIDLTAEIDAMKGGEVLASFKTLSFLPTVREACDQCRRCALQQAPDVFHLAVHKLGEELTCSAKTNRLVIRRNADSAASGVTPTTTVKKTISEIIREALFGAEKRAEPTTIADLIGAYPHLHPFLYAEGDREASFGTLAELAASGKAPQTKLMVAMNDAMQPVNEGTSAPDGPTEYLLVEVNFNPDLKLETVLEIHEDHIDEYIGEMGRPAGKFICEYFDGTGGWKQEVYDAFKDYLDDLNRMAEAEQTCVNEPSRRAASTGRIGNGRSHRGTASSWSRRATTSRSPSRTSCTKLGLMASSCSRSRTRSTTARTSSAKRTITSSQTAVSTAGLSIRWASQPRRASSGRKTCPLPPPRSRPPRRRSHRKKIARFTSRTWAAGR